jgi:hypothetical protein
MAITGLRTTDNFVAEQRPKNWRETILLNYPNATAKSPMTAITSMLPSEATTDPEFNWWEKDFTSQRMTLAANLGLTDTTVNVVSGARQVKAGHVLLVEHTNEYLFVTADANSDTSISVLRAFAGSTAASVTHNGAGVNPNIRIVGSAYEEGSTAPTGINYNPVKRYNYTQIFRNTLEMTRTASKTKLRTGDQVKEARRECMELHSVEMEKAFIWGRRSETVFNGKPLRTTDGIVRFIPASNVQAAGATTNLEQLEGWMERIFRYGSSEKIAFCGNRALLVLNQIVRKNSAFNIQTGIKEYGMNVTRFICPFGELVIFTHMLFNQLGGGTNNSVAYNGWESNLLVVDQTNLKYRYITDTTYEKDLTANGQDGLKSGYLTEAGLEVHHPNSHFLITGLTAAAADS